MSGKFGRSFIWVSVLTLGISAALPTVSWAEETRTVKYDRLPREVRRTLDEERGDHDILGVQWVNQDGKEFFRCTVSLKRGQRLIRIQPGGNLLSVEDIREVEVPAYHAKPDDFVRQHEDREHARREYWAQLDERVRATPRDPERVRWDDLPPGVRATFARESFGEKIDYIVRYRDGSRVIYQTNVPDGRDRVRMIQVTTDGLLINTGEFTTNGRSAPSDWKVRTVEFEDLPRSVRWVLDHNYRGARIPHIDMTVRRGQRVYNVELEELRHDHYLVIDEDGEVLSDVIGHDYGRR